MLNIESAGLSGTQLEETIAGHCASLGTVKHIKVMPPNGERAYAVAVVEMATAVEADKVVVRIGGLKYGATAIIRLVAADGPPQAAPEDAALDPAPAAGLDARPLQILLVEDDPADVRMTREALTSAGIAHCLHVVTDGLEAVSFLYRTRQFDGVPAPDLILLDLNIPKLNGHEVLNEIKTADNLRHIPVVVLTCSAAGRDIEESYRMNADHFVTKPTGLDVYVTEMKKIQTLTLH